MADLTLSLGRFEVCNLRLLHSVGFLSFQRSVGWRVVSRSGLYVECRHFPRNAEFDLDLPPLTIPPQSFGPIAEQVLVP
jgi:hypothetical protein